MILSSAREKRQVEVVFSAWHIGEFIGTLDRRHQQKHLSTADLTSAIQNFSDEILQVAEEDSIRIVPVTGDLLTIPWRIRTREHVYEADALQIASCNAEKCDILFSADRQLRDAAKRENPEPRSRKGPEQNHVVIERDQM